MEYLNFHTSILDSAEFVGADQVERGTWLCLQRYCAGQENGGVIEDCGRWKDRQWQQLVRVTHKEVRAAARLWEWQGEDLVVFYYPIGNETTVKTKRQTARENGKLGGRPPKNPRETHGKPTLVIPDKPKENGRKENENIPPQPPDGGASEGVDLVRLSKSLRREWQASPLLTEREARKFAKNRRLLELFEAADWELQREFMAARLPEGAAYFQPLLLWKYFENPGGVLGDAQAWKRNQRPKLVVVKPVDGPAATAEEVAAIFAEMNPKRMNS